MAPRTAAAAAKLAVVRPSCSAASLRQNAGMTAVRAGALVGQAFALEQRAQLLGLRRLLLRQVPLRLGPRGGELGLLRRAHLGDLHASLDQLGFLLLHHLVVLPV